MTETATDYSILEGRITELQNQVDRMDKEVLLLIVTSLSILGLVCLIPLVKRNKE